MPKYRSSSRKKLNMVLKRRDAKETIEEEPKHISEDLKKLRDSVSEITSKEYKEMENFIKKYIPDWDITGTRFFENWIQNTDNRRFVEGSIDWESTRENIIEQIKLEYMLKLRTYALLDLKKTIRVFRGIEVNEFEEINLNKIGIYWSVNKTVANEKATYIEGNGITVTGLINPAIVNWKESLLTNVGLYDYEDEININQGEKILIEKAEKVHKLNENEFTEKEKVIKRRLKWGENLDLGVSKVYENATAFTD